MTIYLMQTNQTAKDGSLVPTSANQHILNKQNSKQGIYQTKKPKSGHKLP